MDYGLYAALLIMVVSAVAAAAAKTARSSALWAATAGAAVCCAMSLAGAPGPAMLALASAAAGGGFILRASAGSRDDAPSLSRTMPIAMGLAVAGAVAFSTLALGELPQLGDGPSGGAPNVNAQLAFGQTGAANLVASVVFDFRAFDGMCAVAIVAAACCGAMWLFRPGNAAGAPSSFLTPARAAMAWMVIAAAILASAHMILWGHLRAGGAFAGGVTLAAALIATARTFGDETAERLVCLRRSRAVTVLATGALVLVGLAGAGSGYVFFSRVIPPGPHFAVPGAGTIFWASLASGVAIALGLYGAYLAIGAAPGKGST